MSSISLEQIRRFRLHTHHLDTWYPKAETEKAVGACGFQNSPPGAWESALFNRIPNWKPGHIKQLLEAEKTLLQAWSFRGAPVVFPTSESEVFLSALVSREGEPWIYTKGIQLALDYLQMPFAYVLLFLQQVMPKLDDTAIKSKTILDQTLAEWMLPLLPGGKRDLWNGPSMYGSPEKQTVGGAVVSFLLRPCALMGLVVFGKREGVSPTFTSYKRWIGRPMEEKGNAEQRLVQKYLHCFGPASVGGLADWLGCSPAQARRIWQTAADRMEPVDVSGRVRHILSDDKALLSAPPQLKRRVHLLGGHDPYLGLQDRDSILEDKAKQRKIWQTVSNPGAVLCEGAIAGMWKPRKKGDRLDMEIDLWDGAVSHKEVRELCDAYASCRQLKLSKVLLLP